MTDSDDFDRLLGDWLAEGPVRTPEPALATAVQHARSHPRRPDPLAFLRRDPMAGRVSVVGFAPVPVLAALALLVVAGIGVVLVGGQREVPPPPVQPAPTATPSLEPTAEESAEPTVPAAPSPITVGLRTATSATMTVDVLDLTGTLVDARTAAPAAGGSQPTGTVAVTNVDEMTLKVVWTDGACDIAYTLTIDAPDAMTLGAPPCVGDTIAVDRGLLLQFDTPVDAASIDVAVVDLP